jgi:hypothetical protein
MSGDQQHPGTDTPQKNLLEVITSLVNAINDHDLDALTACFADDYVNVTPVHPARGFTGRSKVRQNVDGRVVWTEWEHRGTHVHGAPHLLRGVVIFTVGTDTITGARFFLEPVDQSDQDADAALGHLLDT